LSGSVLLQSFGTWIRNEKFDTQVTPEATMTIKRTIATILGLLLPTFVGAGEVSFSRDVAPILVRRCLGCHDNKKTEGRYALHTFERFMKPGESEELAVVPGNPDKSYLFQKLVESDADLRMPQEDSALATEQIATIRQWIKDGARFDGSDPASHLSTLLPARVHPKAPAVYRVPIPIFALKFSPDGKSLVTGGWHELLVRDTDTGKLLRRIPGMPQRVQKISISPNQQTVAVCGGAPGEYGEIRLIPAAALFGIDKDVSDSSVTTLPAWEDVILDAQLTPDGRRLVAGGADNSVRCYDIASGTEVWQTRQHADWVTAVDVSNYRFVEATFPNDLDNSIFTFNEDDQKSGEHIRQCWDFGEGHFVIREANWELEVTRELTGRSAADITLTRITVSGIGKTYNVLRESFSDDALQPHAKVVDYLTSLFNTWGRSTVGDRFVVSASRDRTVKVFSLADGKLFTTYKGHRREYGPLAGLHRLFGVVAEQRSRRVWSGGEGKHFHGWDPVTVRDEDGTAADMEARFAKEYSTALLRHDVSGPVFSLTGHRDHLFSASADGGVRSYTIGGSDAIFDVNKAAPSRTFAGQSDHLFAVDTNRSGDRIAAAGFNGEVVIWNRESQQIASRWIAAPIAKNLDGENKINPLSTD
jgi:WD40 repeat protein